jgi:perosamine synthetase
MTSKLAFMAEPKQCRPLPGDIFTWPIVTKEDEEAVLEVLRRGAMSGTDVTKLYEQEFAEWQGCRYALGCNTGTAALFSAFFGCKIGVGDEVICPSLTYWASATPAVCYGSHALFSLR